ncbi:MAG: UDP-N-acetylmuramoyl-L-alanine--D-glutamate ligase [Calditrichaceae bacterium]|nr:UDP-N-acetylmuramoyl-L-alanine--D-glutamate ligase [Calditrichaceae bacterium]RQV96651.1 MAG: UDP-N-acetylmuramoyl-L-alanine--D-glutamate ligase [Calditrichota bacterium]
MEVRDKKITILGAARSGVAAARLLKAKGAKVFVSDIMEYALKKDIAKELESEGIPFEFGGHSGKVGESEFIVLSPGIPVKSEFVRSLIAKGIPVYSEIEIASWFCQAPMIAVTGSNGKTTTTTLIGEMLKKCYPDAIVAGNIGFPFSAYVQESHKETWAVIEVSSFQLETIDRFHPKQAVVLNFAPNHLDRYDSYEDYLKAKWRIKKNLNSRDHLIYNAADEKLSEWARNIAAVKLGFDIDGDEKEQAYYKNESIYVFGQKLIDSKDMILRGRHNYMNAMAAALAASNAGISIDQIRETLTTFKGVEHRLEMVREINGVKFVNDSKATTVESLSFALQSFNTPVILIAGGKDKGSDFTRLNDLIKKHVKELVLIGQAAEKMTEIWHKLKPVHHPETLEQAVETAFKLAAPNDVVLLSPACASFDMFSDFEDRGRQFKAIVNGLK